MAIQSRQWAIRDEWEPLRTAALDVGAGCGRKVAEEPLLAGASKQQPEVSTDLRSQCASPAGSDSHNDLPSEPVGDPRSLGPNIGCATSDQCAKVSPADKPELAAYSEDTAVSVGEAHLKTDHPRICRDLNALLPAGASSKLVRTVRDLYDNTNSLSRKPWLLQPVLQGDDPSAPQTCYAGSRPSSANRFRGHGIPRRPPSASLGRPPRRPESARGSSSVVPRLSTSSGSTAEPPVETASIGRVVVAPILSSGGDCGENTHRPDRMKPWQQRPQSARGFSEGLSAPQRAAAEALALLAEENEEVQEAREYKQAKIRTWLARKEAQLLERRRVEEDEARQIHEEKQQRQQKRIAYEAEEQRHKQGRLRAAVRRKEGLLQEIQHACSEGVGPRGKASMAGALAAYGRPRPASARARVR